MTGKDLIIYILQNNLENEVILENGVLCGFLTEEDAAAKLCVGPATIKAWYDYGILQGIKIGDSIYFRESDLEGHQILSNIKSEVNRRG